MVIMMWKKVLDEFFWFLVPLVFGLVMGLGFWAEYGDLIGIVWFYWFIVLVAIILDNSIARARARARELRM